MFRYAYAISNTKEPVKLHLESLLVKTLDYCHRVQYVDPWTGTCTIMM